MQLRSLGQEDPPEEDIATHSSTLAWRIPSTAEPGRLWSMGSQRVRPNCGDLAPGAEIPYAKEQLSTHAATTEARAR